MSPASNQDRDESSSRKAKRGPAFNRAMKRFRRRLAELRADRGLTYLELHTRSGVNWRQIMAIENGESVNPTFVTLTRLADALGVEVHQLVGPVATRSRVAKRRTGVDRSRR